MKLFFLNSPIKKMKNETNEHAQILLHEPLDYTSEGGEFLDDAIRIKDQPLMYTGESTQSEPLDGIDDSARFNK